MSVLQNPRVRLGLGIAAIALAAAAIGAGTYAAFVDTETGPGGTLSSGTLDLTVGGTGAVELFDASNIAPGYSTSTVLALRNAGSLPGTLSSTLRLTGADVTCTEPEAEAEARPGGGCSPAGDLQNQMTVSVVRGPGISTPSAAVPVSQFVTTGLPAAGVVPAGGTVEYELLFTLPNLSGTVNNVVQGDRLTLGSDFTLAQS